METQTRQLTEAALCAKEIRKDLKKAFPTTKFKVTSKNFSMGDSVRVSYTDSIPVSQVKVVIGKYEKGHFDGMIDLYEYSNRRDDIPQTKYLHIDRDLSEGAIMTFANKYKKNWGMNEPTDDLYRSFEWNNEYISWYQLAYRELNGVVLS